MSKRGTVPGASQREYAAAEERLLDFFSPPSDTEEATNASGSNSALQGGDGLERLVDPSKDNMLSFISDNSEIHSLLVSSDSTGFKGFDDERQDYHDEEDETRELQKQTLIFGMLRSVDNFGSLAADNFMGCSTTPKRAFLSPQLIESASIDLMEASTSAGFMLTNGNINDNESTNEVHEEHLTMESQHVIDESDDECVIYDEDNVVMLSDDNCCEIIVSAHGVHTEQEMERAYLMGLPSVPASQREQINNGAIYGSDLCPAEEDEEPRILPHVYLSDAAIDQQQQQPQERQLLLDAAEEDVNQVCDSFVDDRPDICEVYDHELEDHDDDCPVNESSLQLQLQQVALGQQELTITNDVEELQHSSNASDVDELQAKHAAAATATAAIPHSSTTEFPVSSTSMPNASDYDDYDDELGTAEERSPPAQRKYMPLLKNTLSADAMERRLAYIGQSQPQLSLAEKVAIWNCAHNCEAVEDVENFEAVFEQHEAEPAKEPKFGEFCEILRQSLSKMTLAIKERSRGNALHAAVAPDTPYSSDDAARQRRPCFRRLLHAMPQAQQAEPIVVDDDDEDDDDCYEVTVNPSSTTLVPNLHQRLVQREPFVKTIQTQTLSPPPLETKETSTTDLLMNRLPSSDPIDAKELALDSMRQHAADSHLKMDMQLGETGSRKHTMDQQQPQKNRLHTVRANSVEFHNEEQFYEQHEFCNYLGLTGLATANAVATAMRELANNNVSRRSLRVRTQQQLDRMRSSVRGKRRERQQQQQRDPEQQQENIEQQLNSDTSTCTNNSNTSSTKKTPTTSTFVYPRPSAISTVAASAPTIEYYYRTQGGEQEQQNNSVVSASDYHAISLEAAFAKVYAAAAPAQNELHECMQNRLRRARETKPSIYIVQALNNATTNAPAINPVTQSPPERQQNNKKPDQAAEAKPMRKLPKKLSPKAAKRRRTTAGGIVTNGPPDRDLVTRSTTHMNSKLLRNRKVNLLKSYELSDAAALGRGKNRLSGGSTPAGKRVNTPKAVKKTMKKLTQEVITLGPQYVDQQQSSPKPKKTSAHQETQKSTTKRKRLRAKSLPVALDTKQKQQQMQLTADMPDTNEGEATLELRLTQRPKMLLDTHDFITKHAIVSPPLYTTAVRRYVNAVYKPMEQHPIEQHPLEQHPSEPQLQQHPEGFFDLSAAYAKLAKPALTYPPLSPPPSQRAPHFSRRARQVAGTTPDSVDLALPNIQVSSQGGLLSLTQGSTAQRNPLAGKNGQVLYLYYELEQLIAVQEKLVSFWKYSKVFNVLNKAKAEENNATATQQHMFSSFATNTNTNQKTRRNTADSNESDENTNQRWVNLGGTRRITNDIEIYAPHCNRLCAHNSTPVYVEMRSHPLEHHKRESKLLSLYVNVYYYCEEELRPKMHSVHLDAVNCEWNQVIYTSIAESRYFVMAWQQEVVVGKPRAGICKYSLTPTLDTLASIREFKQLRHELKHIECLTEDRLIGYGQTRITIWDHRSGDTLMNYDFNFNLGHNLGVMHFPGFDIDQSSMLVLYQHATESNKCSELRIIACELSHATPSHRVLHVHRLPSPQFDCQLAAINTGDHLILQSPKSDEIWISTADPRQLTYLAPQSNQRFYTRHKSQIITLTPHTLVVDSIANYVLNLAAEHQKKMMIAAMEMVASSGSQLPVSV